MRKIYDYKDLRRFQEATIYDQLQNGVIITATEDLAKQLNVYYPYSKNGRGLFTISMHQIVNTVAGIWENKVKDLRNYVNLRQIIEEFIVTNDLSEIHSAYLRRNATDIWNAIILLVEADVYPDDIPDDVAPIIKEFKHLWKQIEIENQGFVQLKSTLLYNLTERNNLDRLLPAAVRGKELFLLGFYFVTPIQARIISVLENAGYQISFLNRYDKSHPYSFEVWEKTFQEEYKNGSTIDIQPSIQVKNLFVSSIEHDLDVSAGKDGIYIHAYKTDIEFATACMEAKKAGAKLYTTDSKKTDTLLREFFPEEYDDKHLLSYPVGQYVYYLHMLWNEFTEAPELQFEYVFKCFASGWLEDEGVNGKEYLRQLKLLEPYFKNCNMEGMDSFEMWKNRAETLLEAKRVTSVFDDGNDSRWKRMMGNPFNNMAIYQLKEDDIEAIIQLLNRLIKDANELFAGDCTKNLYEHMQKIKKIIESHADKDDTTEAEKLVMEELLNRLGGSDSNGLVCHMNGIKDAILLLIGDHKDKEDSHEEETSEKKRMVKPIAMVEASVLENKGEDIYLVMADEFLLPGSPRKLPWPLSDDFVDSLICKLDVERPESSEFVKHMKNLIKARPLAYRYLFYSLLDNITLHNKPQIHLSWILKQGDKEVAPSPYISLLGLDSVKELEDGEEKWESQIKELVQKAMTEAPDACGKNVIMAPEDKLPEEVKSDYALCKMRYFYSYVLNEMPSFESEFHYSFVLSNTIAALAALSGQGKESVSGHISELFPFFRKVEKQQSKDYAYIYKSEGIEFGGIIYPGNRLDIHYLRPNIKRKAENNALTLFEKGELGWQVDSECCKYCPYSNICRVKYEGVAKYGS